MQVSELTQIKLVQLTPSLLRVIVKQNNFVAGEISNNTFYSQPRSKKNLMYLYSGSEGGLGINEEILHLESFDIIKVKYLDVILTTTHRKWRAKGVTSRYCDATVDKQIILRLSDINMNDTEQYESTEVQENLFAKVT